MYVWIFFFFFFPQHFCKQKCGDKTADFYRTRVYNFYYEFTITKNIIIRLSYQDEWYMRLGGQIFSSYTPCWGLPWVVSECSICYLYIIIAYMLKIYFIPSVWSASLLMVSQMRKERIMSLNLFTCNLLYTCHTVCVKSEIIFHGMPQLLYYQFFIPPEVHSWKCFVTFYYLDKNC